MHCRALVELWNRHRDYLAPTYSYDKSVDLCLRTAILGLSELSVTNLCGVRLGRDIVFENRHGVVISEILSSISNGVRKDFNERASPNWVSKLK